MDRPPVDRPTLIFIGSVLALGFFGAGMITGSALGQPGLPARSTNPLATAGPPAARSSATSDPSPATSGPSPAASYGSPQCSFADFPFYPGSGNYQIYPPLQNAWYVDQPTSVLASYFARGAYQAAWTFAAGPSATVAAGSSVMSYKFRFSRAPACRGELRIFPETLKGASVYQAVPDAP